MEGRKEAAGHRPLVAVGVAGNLGKQVLEVRKAAVVVVVGMVADEVNDEVTEKFAD
jgi:hypothetical protein